MERNGFTLIELVVVIGIIGVILAIATLQFNKLTRKANIEAQAKTLYADLMTVRTQALLQKTDRAVTFTATQFAVYPSVSTSGPPVLQRTLKYPVTPAGATTVLSDTAGMASSIPSGETVAICVEPAEEGPAVDSVIFSQTRITLGKRIPGKDCVINNDPANPNIVTK